MKLSRSNSVSSSMTAKSPKIRQEREERQTNFKVVIRVRPPLPRELSGETPFLNIVAVDEREQSITVSENIQAVLDNDGRVVSNPGLYNTHSFVFDHVYEQGSTQRSVYENTARTVVDSALQGYNATIFAYGQTGTGKTFTMEGFNKEGGIEARGIIPRAIEQIFGHIQRYASPKMRFLVRASYLQIYNEQISDLLKPDRNNLTIREDKRRGVFVDGLSEWVVRSPAEIYGLMQRGGAVRATGETKMNEMSSRSHAVFIVIAEQSQTVYVDQRGAEMSPEEFQKLMHGRGVHREQEMRKLEENIRQSFKVGKLNLVDLAGSERVRLSGATGQRLEESKQINKSLSALGNVISALTEAKSRAHIPYRDSKLTRMLEDSLGGNCKTTMMAMISPAFEAIQETVSTLKFANRAKNIRNEARVNEDLDQKSLLRKYERELKKLRAELEERNKNVVDKRRLLELDEQRRRAEADKMAAIKALEARSLEFMQEKEEKKKLEQRISMLMGQMIRGERSGGAAGEGAVDGENAPELQVMMKEQQESLRKEYEFKLADLERERETIEEEKAQVDRYKHLLLKQRDIMIALTQRLVERDEQIMALQDELDAYDRHHKELEEKLDEKTALLIKFQRISMEVNASSPYKNEELNKAMDSWSHLHEGAKVSGATEVSEDSGRQSPVPNAPQEEKIRALTALVERQQQQLAQIELQKTAGGGGGGDSADLERAMRVELERALDRVRADPALAAVKEPLMRVTLQMMDGVSRSLAQRAGSSSSSSSQNGSYELQQLRKENTQLKAMNRQLESEAGQMGSPGSVVQLQERCDTMLKEREAVQTIMEHKIRVLVQSVAQSAGALLMGPGATQPPSATGQTLAKDIAALQRLVNASIAALKNASAPTPPPSSDTNNNNQNNNGNIPTASSSQIHKNPSTAASGSGSAMSAEHFIRNTAGGSNSARIPSTHLASAGIGSSANGLPLRSPSRLPPDAPSYGAPAGGESNAGDSYSFSRRS